MRRNLRWTRCSSSNGQRISVALITHNFGCGGLERVVSHLATRLPEDIWRVRLVNLARDGHARQWLHGKTIPIDQLHKRPRNDPAAIWRLRRLFLQHKIDIVHSHNWGTLLECVAATRRTNIRLVHAQHGHEQATFEVAGWKRLARAAAMRQLLACTDRVVAVSESVRRWLHNQFGVAPSKMTFIPNGVERPSVSPEDRASTRAQLGISRDSVLFGTVGRAVPVKGFDLLLKSFSNLCASLDNVHLVVVGDGPELASLKRLAHSLGVDDRVHFAGFQSPVSPWLSAMDVYVNSSRSEAMSMSILEAMACKLPIIATDVGDSARLISGDQVAGWIVPPADIPALAEAMRRVACDPDQRNRASQAAYETWQRSYNVDRMIDSYAALYSTLVPKPADCSSAS